MMGTDITDFVADHLKDGDEAVQQQVRKCWKSIVQRSGELEQEASCVVVPEGGITPQEMLDEIMRKIKKMNIQK